MLKIYTTIIYHFYIYVQYITVKRSFKTNFYKIQQDYYQLVIKQVVDIAFFIAFIYFGKIINIFIAPRVRFSWTVCFFHAPWGKEEKNLTSHMYQLK